MKLGHVGLVPMVAVLISVCDATSLRAPQKVSLVAKAQSLTHDDKDMPVTKHDKTAGADYNKGSPLFKKQETMKASGMETATDEKPPEKKMAGLNDGASISVTVPPPEKATDLPRWWRLYGGWKVHTKASLMNFLSFFVVVMFTALIWLKCAGGRSRRGFDEGRRSTGFAYGMFSMDHCCGHHANVCFCTFCCSPLRLADTYSKEPFPFIGQFWVALIIVTCLMGFGQLTFGATTFMLTVLGIYFRQQMRKQYNMEASGTTLLFDILAWFLCPFCAVAQEARQVEFVRKPNDPVGAPPYDAQYGGANKAWQA